MKRVRAFLIKLEFGSVGLRRGETGVPGQKPLGARERTNNKLNPNKGKSPGDEVDSTHIWKTCGVDAIIRTQATLVGGECSHQLSPMRHPFSLTVLTIDRFHMTSRRPYLCTQAWPPIHCFVQKNSVGIEHFSHV